MGEPSGDHDGRSGLASAPLHPAPSLHPLLLPQLHSHSGKSKHASVFPWPSVGEGSKIRISEKKNHPIRWISFRDMYKDDFDDMSNMLQT
jgi:hypothetical protein